MVVVDDFEFHPPINSRAPPRRRHPSGKATQRPAAILIRETRLETCASPVHFYGMQIRQYGHKSIRFSSTDRVGAAGMPTAVKSPTEATRRRRPGRQRVVRCSINNVPLPWPDFQRPRLGSPPPDCLIHLHLLLLLRKCARQKRDHHQRVGDAIAGHLSADSTP